MLAVVCPGQGSQTPGLLSSWAGVPGVGERLAWMAELLGPLGGTDAAGAADLLAHGTTSDADTIRDTAVAQPLIVATGLAVAGALWPGLSASAPLPAPSGVGAVAGHSVGEVTAAVLAGVLTPAQALTLVRERGRAMAAAAARTPTGMSAVVGGAPEDVEAAIARAGATAANRNAAGQVVAAGTREQLAALAADPPARARVVPLAVAGAFHTEHMASAVAVLDALAQELTAQQVPGAPRVALLTNADGSVVRTGQAAVDGIVAQIARPVRWDACMQTLAGLGVTAILELPPAGTLTGLAKRALPGVELLAVKGPDDLAAAADLIARTSSTPLPTSSGSTA